MNAAESTGRKSTAAPQTPPRKLGKDGAIGLSLLGAAFAIAVAVSWYSANTLEQREKNEATPEAH